MLTAGQVGDSPQFTTVLDQLTINRTGSLRPRTRPAAVAADKAYSSKANRAYLRRRAIRAVIPVKDDQAESRRRKGSAGGRPPNFDAALYKQRNVAETGKPECCHIRCPVSSSVLTSSVVSVMASWIACQGRRLCCPRGTWCKARRRSTSAGSARTIRSRA